MNKFYKISLENHEPQHEFELKNLGKKVARYTIASPGPGYIGTHTSYEPTTLHHYDKSFVKILNKIAPLYKIFEFLEFHFNHYEGEKNEFLSQIKYAVLPLLREKNKDGLVQLLNDWVDKKDRTLIPYNTTTMALDETCEILFQMHKRNANYSVDWTKDTFNNQPENLEAAKQKLLSKKIIYLNNDNKYIERTFLDPDLFDTNSYKKALEIVTEKNKPQANYIHNSQNFTTHGPNSPIAGKNLEQNINTINDLSQLEKLGVEKDDIEELRKIISESDKTTFKEKSGKWLSAVSASVVARGLYEHVPAIINFVQNLQPPFGT